MNNHAPHPPLRGTFSPAEKDKAKGPSPIGRGWREAPGEGRRLRLVVFTSSHLSPINRVFFERLASDPLFDLAGIIVDGYRKPIKPLFTRIRSAIRADGIGWIGFKIATIARSIRDRIALGFADRVHGRPRTRDSYDALPVPVYRFDDIHADDSVARIRELAPELGVIVGCRILRDCVTTIPEHGTLNIHKRKVPDYRGGGPVGHWEMLAGEKEIGVTIHYATSAVDTGPVLAATTIPIEACDTAESLKIKADICGAELYHATLRDFAQGHRDGVAQHLDRGKTYRAPSDYKVWKREQELERRANVLATQAMRPAPLVRLRVLMQYLAVLPLLLRIRRRLVMQKRAPISIFFYHLIANRPLNHMCMPLSEFVRQVEFLRRHYEILPLDEAVERLRSGSNDRIAASITFDDGYRDNTWAIRYLRYFDIPATFFVSIGHVRDGSSFEHDRVKGFETATPMSEDELRRLSKDGFLIASHGVHHEDFGAIAPADADRVLRESRDLIAATCGKEPAHFSFPKGQRGQNITEETFDLALKHYPYIYSAYGGYAYPQTGRRHFLRMGNPIDVAELGMLMTGYTGLRQCLSGNPWGLRVETLDPCSNAPRPRPEPAPTALPA